ncbi:MAG TPA: sugar ABC transporter ATP-binding protein, partial [Clostridiales bacterium]|nr:sugar ABC transporter ATP-binding protein [Clostridiales bacterium]
VEAMTMASRIVVMKDGFIQQVDSPANLYERPANLFVAGFIGSPQMNFINALVEERGSGELYLLFGNNVIQLPEPKAKRLAAGGYIDKTVVLGIRPENIHVDEMHLSQMEHSVVSADVEVVEMLGSETLLYVTVNGVKNNVVAKVNPRFRTIVGDKIKMALDPNRIHIFDKETEQTIIN